MQSNGISQLNDWNGKVSKIERHKMTNPQTKEMSIPTRTTNASPLPSGARPKRSQAPASISLPKNSPSGVGMGSGISAVMVGAAVGTPTTGPSLDCGQWCLRLGGLRGSHRLCEQPGDRGQSIRLSAECCSISPGKNIGISFEPIRVAISDNQKWHAAALPG